MSEQSVCALASFSFTWGIHLFVTLVTPIAGRSRALLVVALVDFGVCVTKLDSNISLQLILESDSLNTRDGLDDGRFSVSDMTNGTDIYRGLSCDNFWSEGCEGLDV